eukprot:COSAG04_NODE_9979_length_815_cov_1.296089_1_plen_76_part_00
MASIPEGIPPEVGEIRHTSGNRQQPSVRDRDALEDDDSRTSSAWAAADGTAAPRVGDCLFSQSTVQEQMRHCELA